MLLNELESEATPCYLLVIFVLAQYWAVCKHTESKLVQDFK